jgi:phosphate-selective porin OprO and OprP
MSLGYLRRFGVVVALVMGWGLPALSHAQTPALLDTTITAGESDAQEPVKRGLNKYNEFDFGFTTFRIGYGFLVDFATYVQDDASKQQVTLVDPDAGLRDFRFMFKGKFKTERPLSWTMGIMYDGGTEDWHFRQTGIMVAVPEISSNFFVGRTKEGYSQYKYMVGYDIWTIERSPFLDAFVPIMADGIKWIIAAPRRHLLLNLGWFGDALSEDEKFATYDNQFVARLAYLPVVSEKGKLVHVAVMGRDVEPDEGKFQAKSKPEAYLAPNFVDTGKFDSDHARTLGFEAYYRDGSWLVGGEYGWQWMDAPTVGDPMFHGGNISVAWLVTGETRGYNMVSGYFKAVSPTRTVFEGGPGAVELALNYSFIDMDDGTLEGGTFWRITPLVKWHLMDYLRIELGYGYGVLDRFDLEGKTHFFQGRIVTAL